MDQLTELLNLIRDWWNHNDALANVLASASVILNMVMTALIFASRSGLLNTWKMNHELKKSNELTEENTKAVKNMRLALIAIQEYNNMFAQSTNIDVEKRLALMNKHHEIMNYLATTEEVEVGEKAETNNVIEDIIDRVSPEIVDIYHTIAKGE